jgi:hypothetical protein
MAQQVCVVLSTAEREQLAAIAADRNRRRKRVERARVMRAPADRYSAQRVAQSIGVSRPTVWRSQRIWRAHKLQPHPTRHTYFTLIGWTEPPERIL